MVIMRPGSGKDYMNGGIGQYMGLGSGGFGRHGRGGHGYLHKALHSLWLSPGATSRSLNPFLHSRWTVTAWAPCPGILVHLGGITVICYSILMTKWVAYSPVARGNEPGFIHLL